ncbi:MAG: hypothetical protein JO020_20145 [Chloroflexi bacterium]|nr:hypothetical protein [Chloroflexota bacterium]MBV9896484.1 hypothetical protein [Chloroflexota bacterium]
MAVESRAPIEVESVRDEERFFGGDIVWWCLLLLVSIPVLLWGLAAIPDTGGFLLLALGGIMAGVGFTQIMMRLPYLTNGFMRSVLIVLVAAVILCGIALLYNFTLDVPNAPQDVMFKPPISGG